MTDGAEHWPEFPGPDADRKGRTGDAIRLTLPISEEEARSLRAGDRVSINGVMYTARDRAHAFLLETDHRDLREQMPGSFIYHCGPVARMEDGRWTFVSAGPTTSSRQEMYEDLIIEEYGIRGIVGKGGMGPRTAAALRKHGAVYVQAAGGAGAVLAGHVREVKGVHMLDEFGIPEAIWVIEVEDFPAIVAMDSAGGSIYDEVRAASKKALNIYLDMEPFR